MGFIRFMAAHIFAGKKTTFKMAVTLTVYIHRCIKVGPKKGGGGYPKKQNVN